MKTIEFPRIQYTDNFTPIEHLKHLSKKFNGPNIFIKRDDLLGLTMGGNKTRKLEYLIADAKKKGADTIITCGALQSNHCRLTLSAAVKEGMNCVLVLEEGPANNYNPKASGNNFLYNLLGAENIRIVPNGSNMLLEMDQLASDLTKAGHTPYLIPVGGSNEIGTMGYINCAKEVIQQTAEMGLEIDYIVVASGSGGTHAGLIAGLFLEEKQIPVIGINVSRQEKQQTELIQSLLSKTAEYIGIDKEIPKSLVSCKDEYVGPGYALPTNEMIESVQLLARTEGILLDPVYTGKVMAGLIDQINNGTFKEDDNVLFIHTGGAPGLFAYEDIVLENID